MLPLPPFYRGKDTFAHCDTLSATVMALTSPLRPSGTYHAVGEH